MKSWVNVLTESDDDGSLEARQKFDSEIKRQRCQLRVRQVCLLTTDPQIRTLIVSYKKR